MNVKLAERTGEHLLALGRALIPFLRLLESDEDIAAFTEDLDRLTVMIADHAGVVVICNVIAEMARKLRAGAAVAFDQEAEDTLARIEGSAMRLRDSWAVHVDSRRHRRSREEDGKA